MKKSHPLCSHPSVRRFMGNVHVGESALSVVRKITKEFPKDGFETFRALPAKERRYVIACALNEHAENQSLYSIVMARRDKKPAWAYQFNKEGKTPKTTVIIP